MYRLRTWRNTPYQLGIDPGNGGTHSADCLSTQYMTEHALPNWNWPSTWQNTFCKHKIDPGHGGIHSSNWQNTLLTGNLPIVWWNTLLTENWPRSWQNTLCRTEIDPVHGGTHSAHWELIRNLPDELYATGSKARSACLITKLFDLPKTIGCKFENHETFVNLPHF